MPRKKSGISYGFGQSNVWFASDADKNDSLKQFLAGITKQIENYAGENGIDNMSKWEHRMFGRFPIVEVQDSKKDERLYNSRTDKESL